MTDGKSDWQPKGEFRLPPQNIEAEEGVLGAILLDNDVLHDISAFLKAEDFYRDTHRKIYQAILDLYADGKAVDAVTLADELTYRKEFEAVGGDETLARMLDRVPHAANAKYHAQIVRQKAVCRALIGAASDILEAGYSNAVTAEDLLEAAEQKVFAIADQEVTGDVLPLSETLPETMDRVIRRADHNEVEGLGSGFPDLDDLLGGLRPGNLIIVGARPSMGKTALAVQIADYVATELRVGVLVVSLEMARGELSERLLCLRSQVYNHKVQTGQGLNTVDQIALGKAYDTLRMSPLLIDDAPGRTMLQIFAAARRAKLRHGLGLIVIDYVQLIDADNARDSRQEQISKISRRLKTLSRELKVPVIALSQLNRQVETREDRRPRMADLRESGAIEQDADAVLLLYRPEYYDPNDQPGIAEVIVGKNRHGATGSIKLTFQKSFGKFESLGVIEPPADAPPIEAFDRPF